ncbi:MAG: response regulator, partial [Desulfobulbaceae bacterium]|nr:response regulator [Desulfobulbaceae bacterium]
MTVDLQMKILLVEDAGTMRKMEAKILNQVGFTNIVEAADGREALDRLEAEGDDIRLIISDWAMPNMDGYELLGRVRAEARFKDIPFVMATGHGDKEYVAKAKAAGASGVVAKPFTADDLKTL